MIGRIPVDKKSLRIIAVERNLVAKRERALQGGAKPDAADIDCFP
jgi:hypothetical protein